METIVWTLQYYAERLPIELFVFIGSFIEEAVSPIPSFLVLVPAGIAAHVQHLPWWYLGVLAILSACGRILASILLYVLADKSEDVLFAKGRRVFGMSHAQLERYGKYVSGSSRDWVALFSLNAIPALPTAMLSLACGFIKINFRMFVTATFFGAIIHSLIHLCIGYAGLQVVTTLENLQLASQIIAILALCALVVSFVVYRRKRRGPVDHL